jgi:hypothetical protein
MARATREAGVARGDEPRRVASIGIGVRVSKQVSVTPTPAANGEDFSNQASQPSEMLLAALSTFSVKRKRKEKTSSAGSNGRQEGAP